MNRLPKDFVEKMNRFGKEEIPFLFIIDFELNKPLIYRLDELPANVQFDIDSRPYPSYRNITIESFPESFELYKSKFELVNRAIHAGDSYLLNLTSRTPIIADADLEKIYKYANAKYKLKFKDEFVCFSPEPFIKIKDNQVWSFPMKGTIDASTPNAAKTLTLNKKELAEHYTIVDLIRNDLSKIAKNVRVDKFRYTEQIDSFSGGLLQQSSAIVGDIGEFWKNQIGSIFEEMLPAGSISGAPKTKTKELIRAAERIERGYYTGIFGVFDGDTIDSGVMIRFIEKESDELYFRSGGGITHQSDVKEEYEELIKKIYVPIFRKHQDPKPKGPLIALSQC